MIMMRFFFLLLASLNFCDLWTVHCFSSASLKLNQGTTIYNDYHDKVGRTQYGNNGPLYATVQRQETSSSSSSLTHSARDKFVSENKLELLKLAVIAIIGTISAVAVPLFFSRVLSALSAAKFDLQALFKPLSMMMLCHTVEPVMTILYVRKCSFLIDRFISSLRMSVYSNILRLGLALGLRLCA
jgi:hypothetical protein